MFVDICRNVERIFWLYWPTRPNSHRWSLVLMMVSVSMSVCPSSAHKSKSWLTMPLGLVGHFKFTRLIFKLFLLTYYTLATDWLSRSCTGSSLPCQAGRSWCTSGWGCPCRSAGPTGRTRKEQTLSKWSHPEGSSQILSQPRRWFSDLRKQICDTLSWDTDITDIIKSVSHGISQFYSGYVGLTLLCFLGLTKIYVIQWVGTRTLAPFLYVSWYIRYN